VVKVRPILLYRQNPHICGKDKICNLTQGKILAKEISCAEKDMLK
jgi:hypothetical protein